jgi:pilus assembly protein TadC
MSVQPVVLACALVAAAGMLLVVGALGMFGGVRLRWGNFNLEAESNRIEGITPATGSFLERVLSPLMHMVAERTGESERAWVEQTYDLLDRKGKGSSDYYLKQVVGGIAGFAAGITLGLLTAANGLPVLLLLLPLSLSLGGFFLPRWELQHDLKQRAESIFFEVPYMLDRLGVNLAARKGDLVDSLTATLARPEGGYLTRELLQVVEDNAKAGHIDRALERMAQRNHDIPIVVRLAELLANSQHGAVDLSQSLQAIGDRATEEVENRIRRRGEENSQAMIVPSMLALAGVMFVMLGPALIDLGSLLR